MAAPGKAQMLNEVQDLLKRRYKLDACTERLSVLEAVVYGLCHDGTTREQASQALNRFRDQFFDWNEVRVSSIDEIKGVLAGQPDAEERAMTLRRFLRQLFEKEYKFEIDALAKKPLRDSVKILQEYAAFENDYVLATVIQQALGGHAIPVDKPLVRALIRLEIVEESTEIEAVRSLLERAVPKNRGTEFVDLMEELTHDTCVSGFPDCPRCELKKICPTGQSRLAAEKLAAKSANKVASAKAKDVEPPLPPDAELPKKAKLSAKPTPPKTPKDAQSPKGGPQRGK